MATNPLTATTELEAVNLMLGSIGESPVDTLDSATHPDASDAENLLRQAGNEVLKQGWHFNTFENWTLSPDGSGNITVPTGTLEIDTSGASQSVDVVQKGNMLYDKTNRTLVFTQDLVCTVIINVDFEDLPQAARDYILEVAGMRFQAGKVGSPLLHRFSEQTMFKARAFLRKHHNRTADRNMLRDNYDIARIQQFGRRRANFHSR